MENTRMKLKVTKNWNYCKAEKEEKYYYLRPIIKQENRTEQEVLTVWSNKKFGKKGNTAKNQNKNMSNQKTVKYTASSRIQIEEQKLNV